MGRSIALTIAREGANVVVNYVNSSDSAAAIVAHIEGQGGHAFPCQADVTQPDQCKTLVDMAIDRFGQVDICIIGPGGGWHQEAVDKLDSAAALDDVQKELGPIYHLMPLVLSGMYR
jgi:3-oxoacyl-[acyl-carrier protein] reductase